VEEVGGEEEEDEWEEERDESGVEDDVLREGEGFLDGILVFNVVFSKEKGEERRGRKGKRDASQKLRFLLVDDESFWREDLIQSRALYTCVEVAQCWMRRIVGEREIKGRRRVQPTSEGELGFVSFFFR